MAVAAPSASPPSAEAMASGIAERWRVYDRPELQSALGPAKGDGRELMLTLDGMHCAACAARVEKLVAGRVGGLRVNVATKTASFTWTPAQGTLSKLLNDLDLAGFEPRLLAGDTQADDLKIERRRSLARIGLAVICAMQVMMLAWPGYFKEIPAPEINTMLRYAQWLLATPCVWWSGWPFFRNAWRAFKARQLDMDVPVAVSLLAAYGFSTYRTFAGAGDLYFDTATMFVAILLIGRHLEQRTRAVATERLRRLSGARALTAQRECTSGVEVVPIAQLALGDIVRVAGGETLPVDGELLSTAAELDESLLTGESHPVLHKIGERVLAGSLHVGNQSLRIRATAVGTETQLAAITALTEHGQSADSPARLRSARIHVAANRIARKLVLGVLLLAFGGAAWALPHGIDSALTVALAVLVASCPCALSLAVPAALAAASSKLANRGVLLADAQALMQLPHVDTVLFDKTGTLTEPTLRLQAVIPLGESQAQNIDSQRILDIVAALERGSRHPIARAFDAIASPLHAQGLTQLPGSGVEGEIDGIRYQLGIPSADSLAHYARNTALEQRADVALTDVALADVTLIELRSEQQALALLALRAEARPDAAATIQALQALGLKIELLSGDAPAATQAVGQQLGIATVAARQTPADKLSRLHQLQAAGACVLAIGDGLNDAPFLAAADVSAALPQGAALTQSRAGLILVNDQLSGLIDTFAVAARMNRRIRENFAWALAYNLAVLPLAITGHLPPWLAATGMSISSLLVCANALRLGGQFHIPSGANHSNSVTAPVSP